MLRHLSKALQIVFPTAIPNEDFKLVDLSDGLGPRISFWNEVKLGPKPKLDDQRLIDVNNQLEISLTQDRQDKTLEISELRKFKEINLDTLTNDQLKAAVKWLIKRELRRL